MRKLLIAATHCFPLWRIPDWLPARVQARFPELQVVHLPGFDGISRELPDTEIFAGFYLPPDAFPLARSLRYIHCTAAGVNQLCFPALVESPVILTNSSTVMAPAVAEHTIALMLALAKRIPSAMRYQREQFWAQTEVAMETPTIMELSGATLGMVGLGAIGRELVPLARAFGMRVIAVKRDPTTGVGGLSGGPGALADRVLPPGGLHEMLAEADYIVLAAPQTAATTHMIGEAEFAAMKQSAYFINVARGALVDDRALVRALETKRIAGAAADVFDAEPLPPESPLWKAPNMLITPHLAATTDRLWQRHADLLEDNIARYLEGRPLRNVVDKHAGY